MRRLYYIIFATIACILTAGCGADSAMRKGDKFYALGEYFDAATQYKKAYSQTKANDKPLRGQRALKMADCFRRINYTQKAIAAYNNAVRFKQIDSTSLMHLGRLQLNPHSPPATSAKPCNPPSFSLSSSSRCSSRRSG